MSAIFSATFFSEFLSHFQLMSFEYVSYQQQW